jgi:5-oxoprolinase (ATP-hydrolysing)
MRDRRRRIARRSRRGFITIAVENMANAIKKISVQRGYDVTGYALNCFGGAGGQHACLVADALGMKAVLIHPYSGLLSAYGIGLAKTYRAAPARAGRAAGRKTAGPIDGRSSTSCAERTGES